MKREQALVHEPVEETTAIRDLEATGKIIQKFESDWHEIHNQNQKNFQNGARADQLLRNLLENCHAHVSVAKEIEASAFALKDMRSDVDNLNQIADGLFSSLSTLEDRIDQVSTDYERHVFEEWKQLERTRSQKVMAEKSEALANHEAQLKQKYEEHDRVQAEQRVGLYEATFNAELEEYRRKRENQVDALYANERRRSVTTSLESLRLENADGHDLDQFLSDTSESKGEDRIAIAERADKKLEKKKQTPTKPDSSEDESDDDEAGVEILGDEDYEDL
ncbi:hypothetical protein BCR43DRAFT_484297 [Syncephalastrum racemosum]|uniref:Uncharacterized protein n=1 Tax=Syncephalastrum racemosum TaxID=13706 RepID=A0A1X2HWQ6_SYNRA|nr:hypothetical protein BCR43DRAFT_484297 [Syncephalastrum racemosum]